MSAALVTGRFAAALGAAHAALDELRSASVLAFTDDEVLDGLRELERLRRRLPSIEHRLVKEAETRSLPSTLAHGSTASFLRGLLHIEPGEAAARARAADAFADRMVGGELVGPIYRHVAEAQAAGEVSARAADLIIATVDALPDEAQAAAGDRIERDLVGYAQQFDAVQLGRLALRIRDCYDPDGVEEAHEHRQRTRDLMLSIRPDGSSTAAGRLTAELTERLLVLFDSLAAPKPRQPVDGGAPQQDPRTAGQRRHDALLEAVQLIGRAELTPNAGGVSATVVVTMDIDTYERRKGLATTAHGALVPAARALEWGGANIRLLAVAFDSMKAITAYSNVQRCYTEQQRLALWARDRGCVFPACDRPPGWSEINHVTTWVDGRRTSVDIGAVMCSAHHATFEALGWTCCMIDGRPWFVPPRWIDRAQRPTRNTVHDVLG